MSLNITPSDSCADLLLDLLAADRQPDDFLVIGVTSAVRQEGRSSLAGSLSESLSQEMNRMTLLIDLDLDHGELARHYGFNDGYGLADLMLDDLPTDLVLHEAGPNLHVIGKPTRGLRLSSQLLEKGLPLSQVKDRLARRPVVVLDLPPLLDSPFGVQMAGLANRLIMAVRADATAATTVDTALNRLDQAGYRSKLAGMVLVGAKQRAPRWLTKSGRQ